MPATIKYNNKIIINIPDGHNAILPIKDKQMATDITVDVIRPQNWDGTDILVVPVEDLILTIDETVYPMLPLMTWYEWVNDTYYNTGNFICNTEDSGIFINNSQSYIIDNNNNVVYGANVIVPNGIYKILAPISLFLEDDGSKLVDANGQTLNLKEE